MKYDNEIKDKESKPDKCLVDALVMPRWEDVNFVIKWTLQNINYLSPEDTYLIEKETDNCHLELMKLVQGVA